MRVAGPDRAARDSPADALPGVGDAARRVRKVLVIASRFPPVASVGAIRVRKFVKYLPTFGWQPVVLTGAMRAGRPAEEDARRASDYESLGDLPSELPVHRLSAVLDDLPGRLARRLSGALGGITGYLGAGRERWQGFLDWRIQALHDRLAFPDRGIWRLGPAVAAALALHRRHGFDAIFSSGMPFSDHVIALAVQALLRRPWLADFRDPWVEYIHWHQWQTRAGRWLTHAAEAAVVRRAACVISVNEQMTHRFAARYGEAVARKCVTIANGFDPGDFPCEPAPRREEFRLLYAGSLYATRSPAAVLEAFRLFLRQTPGSAGRAWFEFAGRAGPHQERLREEESRGGVRCLGVLPHGQTLRRMAEADVNVILLPNLAGGVNDSTAKLYEYLGSGRHILAVAPAEGAAAAHLAGQAGVVLCNPDDAEGIAAAMAGLYREWLGGRLGRVSRGGLEAVTRQHQARKLAERLSRAAGRREGGR